jgi:anti-anti-sigma factor
MLTIQAEKTGDVAVVRCGDRVVRGETVNRLRNAVLLQKEARMIVLDLSEVKAIDAGGLSTLVSLHHWSVSRGIQLKLVNPSSFVHSLLTLTRLDRVFEMPAFDDALWILSGIPGSRLQHVTARTCVPCR